MRSRIAAGLLAVLAGAAGDTVAVADAEARMFTRVRGLDAEFQALIREGDARSITFRDLVDEIQRSNTIVMIQYGQCAKGLIRSCVAHVSGDPKARNIRIVINTRTTNDRLIATIAHELHHAVEIIRTPDATDAEQVMALYRRIGKGDCAKGRSDRCETEAALAVEAKVLDELDRSLRRQP
jgi:hypothetical protein